MSFLGVNDSFGGCRTYQVGFILSLVMGLGIGEMMYGRYTDAAYAKLM